MKKIILSVTALLAFGLANAQDAKPNDAATGKKATYGVKVGLNVSNVAGDEDATAAANIHGGFFAEFKVNDNFSIQPEVLYSMQGAKDETVIIEEGIAYHVEEKLKLAYLNVPIMAKYYVDKKFSVLAGPQVGFLISAKDKIKVSDGVNSGSDEIDVKDQLTSVDFGFNAGLGYDFSNKIYAEVRYNLGLSNIFDASGADGFNRVLQVSLGIKF